MRSSGILKQLIGLSHELGREDRQLAILGEGNVSADLGGGEFYVKASGSQLADIDADGITRVRMQPIFDALDSPDRTDDEVREILKSSCADKKARLPSVETFLHAICLREGGAKWVGHTHPVSVLKILCNTLGADPFLNHIFPDAIVVCGRRLAVVPYVDPGIRLAVALRASLRDFIAEHNAPPKVILMLNHGPVILGQTPRDVLNTTLMLDKWANILAATFMISGPRFLDETLSDRIENRPDEHYRRRAIGNLK
ncbi:MAG TPA: class II aldolase/adducin family protein [Verrucomicrobiae bacterium]|nr:class II aldolase/adducin family protein [Verrucomicrobiae bacterium]